MDRKREKASASNRTRELRKNNCAAASDRNRLWGLFFPHRSDKWRLQQQQLVVWMNFWFKRAEESRRAALFGFLFSVQQVILFIFCWVDYYHYEVIWFAADIKARPVNNYTGQHKLLAFWVVIEKIDSLWYYIDTLGMRCFKFLLY